MSEVAGGRSTLTYLRTLRFGAIGAFAAALLAGRPATAQEKVWIGGSSELWSNSANWLDGSTPVAGGSPSLSLRFNNAATSTDDLPGAFSLGKLTVSIISSGLTSIGASGGSTLRFAGVAPGIELRGIGDTMLSAPLQMDGTGGGLTISGAGPGTLYLFGPISQGASSQTLTIATGATSPNVATVQLSGTQTFSGGVALQSGNLALASNEALGTGPLIVHGGTLTLAGSNMIVPNPIILHGDLTLRTRPGVGVNFHSLSGAISSAAPGAGLILRTSGDIVSLSAASTYTGTTTLDYSSAPETATAAGGTLRISGSNGSASLLQTVAFNVRSGSTLELVGYGSADNHVGDTTPIHLRGGGLTYTANLSGSNTQHVETVGPVDGSGYSAIAASTGSGYRMLLNLQSLARTERGTFLFRGTSLGSTPASGVGNIFLNTAPSDLVGGGGTGPATSILPYVIGDTNAFGSGVGFVTYSATTGLRPLNNTTEYRATLATAAPNENVRLTATEALNASRTVNALMLDGGSITGTGTLSIASGALFQRSGSGISAPLDFGSAEANIFANGNLVLSGPVTGTNGLTKSGAGKLTLGAPNSFTGPLTINAGTIAFAAADRLGPDSSAIIINGHGAGLSYVGTAPLNFSRPIQTRTGLAMLDVSGTADLNITTPIGGEGGLQITSSTGRTVALPAGSTYAGTTHLGIGRVTISGDSAFGTGGALNFAGATLALTGAWTSTREINLVSGILNTAGFDATLSGVVTGDGALTKLGAGELTLTAPSRFRGTLAVQGGALVLSDSGALAASISVSNGAELCLDHSTTTGTNRFGDTSTVTLAGGNLVVVGNANTPVTEQAGNLVLSGGRSDQTLSLVTSGAAGVTLRINNGLTLGDSDLVVRAPQLGTQQRLVVAKPAALGSGIVRGVYADTTSAGAGNSFVVYDNGVDTGGVIGIRPLRAQEYTAVPVLQNPATGGSTPATAHFLAEAGVTANGTSNTIDSLTLGSGANLTLGAAQSLGISSGQVLVRTGASGITGGTLAFGNRRADFYTAGDLTLGSTITGSGGLKKSGPGTLIFSGTVGYTGGTLITGGVLRPGVGDPFAMDTVTVNAPGTFDVGAGSFTVGALNGSGRVSLNGGTLTLGGLGSTFTFSGGFSGSGHIVIDDGGNAAVQRTFNGSSTFTGDVVLNSGRLSLGSANALGSGTWIVNGGSLRASSALAISPTLVLNAELPVLGTNPLTLGPGTAVGGAKDLVLRSTGGLNITGTLEFGGQLRTQYGPNDEFVLTPGTITIQGAEGSVSAPAGIRIEAGGRLLLSETTAYSGAGEGRLENTTPVHLGAGILQYTANAAVNASESFGALTSAGFSKVTLTPTTATSATLTTASFGRVDRGTFSIGASTGTLGVALAPNVAQLFASTAPALVGGGSTGANTSIIPWVVGTTGTTAGLVTYGANGVRLLTSSEYVTSLAAATATNNLQLNTSTTNSAPRTVNALSIGAIALSGTSALTVTSGTVLSTATSSGPVISIPLNFGNAEAQFFFPLSNSATLTVSGVITGTGGLTRSGFGALTLAGDNEFNGPITINGGALNFSTNANLGKSTDSITLHGHDASLTFTGTSNIALSRDLRLGGGISRLAASQSTGTIEFSNAITGPGGLRVVGPGTVVLNAPNSYSGPTIIDGSAAITSDASLGTDTGLYFGASGATLRLLGEWNTDRRVEIQNAAIIDTNGHQAHITTPLVRPGSGTLQKSGGGVLRLSAEQTFNGAVTVQGGELRIEQAATLPAPGFTVTGAAALTLDNGASVVGDRILDTTMVALNGGEVRLLGNAATAVNEKIGAVTLGANTANVITVSTPGNAASTLTLAGFTPSTGNTLFRGDRLGSTESINSARIVFETTPSFPRGIIPGALADESSTGVGNSFAIYDTASDDRGTIGVRPLRASEYVTSTEIRNPGNGGTTPLDANYFATGATMAGGANNRIGTLRLGGTANVTLAPAQVLTLDIPAVLVDTGTNAVFRGGVLDFAANPAHLITQGNLSLGSRVPNVTILKSGAGALTLDGEAKLLGTLNVNAGTVNVDAPDALRLATVNLLSGTTLSFSQQSGSVGTITGAGQVNLSGGMLSVRTVGAGVSVRGTGDVTVGASGSLSEPQTFSGRLAVVADGSSSATDTVTLSGNGTALSVSAISIGPSSELALNNGTKALSRLAAVPVAIDGGKLSLTGASSASVTQSFGPLTARGGITLAVSGSSNQTTLSFGDFIREDRATLRFEGTANLGGSVLRITLPNTVLSSLVGVGSNATNLPILPFATSFDTTNGTRAVTYVSGVGVRPLAANEMSSTLVAGNNVRLTNSSGVSNDAAVSINSLVTLWDIRGSGTLNVSSGLIAAVGGTISISNALDFGSSEAHLVADVSTLTLTGTLSGSGGLTKSGQGVLVLPAVNNITGPVTVNAGTVSFAEPAQLGAGTDEIVLHGGGVTWSGTGDLVFPRALRLGGVASAGTTSTGGVLHIAQPVTGPGSLNIVGNVVFDTAPAYTGATLVSGALTLGSDTLLGSSSQLRFTGGTLALSGPLSTNREVVVQNGTIDTAGFDAVLSGALTGSGGLTKTGAGRLSLADTPGFRGTLTVKGGTLRIDDSGTPLVDRLADSLSIALAGGTFEMLGNSSVFTREQIGELRTTDGTSSRLRLTASGNVGHVLQANTLTTANGALVLVQADGLGGGPNGAFTRIVQTSSAPASGTFISGWVVGDASGMPRSLAIYDQTVDAAGTVGLRAARPDEFVSGPAIQNPLNGGTVPASANFRVNGTVAVFGTSTDVRTLTLTGGAALSLPVGTELRVNGGTILTPGDQSGATINGGTLNSTYGFSFVMGGDLVVESNLSGLNGKLRKTGPGTLTLSGKVTTQGVSLDEGALKLSGGDPLATQSVTMAPGTKLDVASRSVSVNGLRGSGVIDLGTGGTLSLKGTTDFAGATQGSGTLRVLQEPFVLPAVFTPSGRLTHAGPIVVEGGSLILQGAGQIVGTPELRAVENGKVSVRNSIGLPSTTALALAGGTLDLQPDTTSLRLGMVTGYGFGTIAPQHVNQALQVDFAGISRGPEGAAVFRIDADNANLGASPGMGVANLRFGTGFSANLVGGPGVTPIIPFMVASVSPGGYGDYRLVTYDEANGARMLTDGEYSATPASGSNYRFSNFTANDVPITVNTLSNIDNSAFLYGSGSVNITGGLALLSNANIGAPLNFGARQGNIFASGYARFSAPISGTGGLTLTGGEIDLSTNNSFTGPLVINGAYIEFTDMSSFGAGSDAITIYRSTLEHTGFNVDTINFDRPLRLAGGSVQFLGTSLSVFNFKAPISGPGGLDLQFSKSMSLTGANSYTGPTTIHTDLTINGDNAFGQSSEIRLEYGSITVTDSWTTNKPVRMTGAVSTLNTNGFDISLLGSLSSDSPNGVLTKTGAGRLKISDATDFLGKLTVVAGSVELAGKLSGSITGNSGTTVTGCGSIAGTLEVQGILAPGAEVGDLEVGKLQLNTNATLRVRLDSATAYDRVVSRTAPSIGSNITLELQLAPAFDPVDNFDQFIVLLNKSSDPISAATTAPFVFGGNPLDEGEVFNAGGQQWRISYTGGSGNDVVLYAIPEPSMCMTLAAGLTMLGLRRRRAR
ncbi:autotransporter-associated beta strand repeat-containing protein [Verrucomicrobiota bacterium sgz303538]